jgi:Kelch motif
MQSFFDTAVTSAHALDLSCCSEERGAADYNPTQAGHTPLLKGGSAVQARGGAAFVGTGDCLYVIGGFNGSELGDTHVFDVAAGSWKQLDTSSAQQQLPPRSVAGIVATSSPGQLASGRLCHISGADNAAWLMASGQQVACAGSSSHPPVLLQRWGLIRGVMLQAAAAAAVACCWYSAVRWSQQISATMPPVRTAV